MLDLRQIFAMQKKALFFLLALCVLGWAFTSYQTVFAGIAVGTFFGTYNFWILVRRMDKFDQSLREGQKVKSLGTGLRFASGVAAVAISYMFPQYFHLISTVIGLMIPYVVLFIGAFVYTVKDK